MKAFGAWPLAGILVVAVAAAPACAGEEEEPALSPEPAGVATESESPLGPLTEEDVKALLTVEDVGGHLPVQVSLKTAIINIRNAAESSDPQQVVAMESWYGQTFQIDGEPRGLTFSVMDLSSDASAMAHFEDAQSTTPGMTMMDLPIGDMSAEVGGEPGLAPIVVFLRGDLLVGLHTSHAKDSKPFMPLENLQRLARLVENRLGR